MSVETPHRLSPSSWNTTRMLVMALAGILGTQRCDATDHVFSNDVAPLLQTHCFGCHSADGEGDVDLTQLRWETLGDQMELVSRLIEVIDLQEMPPEDEPAINADVRSGLVKSLQTILQNGVADSPQYLHTPIRRMNRFQYNNAVIDLFDLRCIVFTLPERMLREHKRYFRPETGKMADLVSVGSRPLGKSQMIEPRLAGVAAFPQDLRAEHGFDNRGDHLSLSPLLMEAFLKLGQSITQSPDFNTKQVGIWTTFFAQPKPEADVVAEINRRLTPFLTRAFRCPIDANTLSRYGRFVQRQLDDGVQFSNAMKAVAAATIASPRFLYLFDHVPSESTAERTLRIDDLELASRLSFFLWGSVPDETLVQLAQDGMLSDPDVLDHQIDRMFKDRRLKRFCDSFPAQWLQLERIISSVPEPEKFPDFYYSKYRNSMHMMLEPLLLFETVLIENRPIADLIDSDFTYRSTLLEKSYGDLSDAPEGAKRREGGQVGVLNFRRVPVKDRRTGGLITNAAVMTMTSGPERTQPITRGAWIATVIFNNPPEPPPADVPALGEKPADGEEHLTLRERLSAHRERADCNGCHEQIDPLGFALENFDAIGQWRDQYENGRDVDMAGTLFRQHDFADVVEFKDAILTEKDRFARALAGHLLSYALARQLGPADQIALDNIVNAASGDDFRLQTLIKQVILSEPFHSQSNQNDVQQTQ